MAENNIPPHIINALREFKRNIGFYYSYFIDKALIPPDIVQISLMYRCNLQCKMCNIRDIKVDREITSERVISLIDEAAQWRVPEVLFLGGEPFLHRDLMKFVNYASDKKLNTTIVTNGSLIDERTAEIIANSSLTQLVISLDGARQITHDSIRGVKGTYKKIIEAIKKVGKYKKRRGKKRFDYPFIIIPMTLMNDNLNEMWQYVTLGNKLPTSAVGFQPVVIDNSDLKFRDIDNPMWIPHNRLAVLDKMVDRIIQYKKKRKFRQPVVGNTFEHLEAIKEYFRNKIAQNYINCYVGYTRVVISPDGDVSLCGIGIGNVNDQTMREIWYSEAANNERYRIRQCKNHCLQFCTVRPQSELNNAFGIFTNNSNYYECDREVKSLVSNRLRKVLSDIKTLLSNEVKNIDRLNMLNSEIDNIVSRINN